VINKRTRENDLNSKINTQKELQEMLMQSDWNIFGTLKFQPIRMISGHRSHSLLKHYWNKMDRVIYGKAAQNGCRIQRWCLAHEGSHNDNYHIHFVARSPIDADLFCCLSNALWAKQDRATASINKNWITPVIHRRRVANYMTKEVWKLGPATYDVFLSCSNPADFEWNKVREDQQVARIRSAMSPNEEYATRAVLEKHKAETQRRLALRD
jgi:hypothetical protein